MDAQTPIRAPELWVGWEDSCVDPHARELRAQFERLVKKRRFNQKDERRIAGAANLMQRMYENVADRNDGAKPIVHILRVAMRVLSYGVKDPDIVIAALLHDAIEDHLETFARLKESPTGNDQNDAPQSDLDMALGYVREQCSGEVADIIEHTTRVKPAGYEKLTREEKLHDYLLYIQNTIQFPKVIIVKVADNVDNVFNPSPDKDQRKYSMQKYAHSTKILLDGVHESRRELLKVGGPLLYMKLWVDLASANKQALSWQALDASA